MLAEEIAKPSIADENNDFIELVVSLSSGLLLKDKYVDLDAKSLLGEKASATRPAANSAETKSLIFVKGTYCTLVRVPTLPHWVVHGHRQ